MTPEGKYIYCIILSMHDRNFGPIGVGGRRDEVLTIGYEDLTMVVSNHPLAKIKSSPENLLAHERVIEEVMKEFASVLPIRFGTIAANADEIRNLLGRRYREFKNLLRDMEHFVELGVKGTWRHMDVIFKEIEKENEPIRKEKKKISSHPGEHDLEAREKIGKMVMDALQVKKAAEADAVVDALRRSAYEFKVNNTSGDEQCLNASFLVGRGREKEFDNVMNELGEKYKNRVQFAYSGPFPVFNFVNITIYPEEWEK
ncbi:MAG: GvpL/GvpF family gas vesicle protein [bacterium]|nr:GvpL/GvpF family gas vesicle protein [bacterium]